MSNPLPRKSATQKELQDSCQLCFSLLYFDLMVRRSGCGRRRRGGGGDSGGGGDVSR